MKFREYLNEQKRVVVIYDFPSKEIAKKVANEIKKMNYKVSTNLGGSDLALSGKTIEIEGNKIAFADKGTIKELIKSNNGKLSNGQKGINREKF